MSHLRKKVNVERFNSFPVKCSSTIVMVSATRLLACHKTRRHKDTRRSHANRIFTLPDKMRLFFAIEIIPGKSVHVVSQPCSSAYCTSVHPRKKKDKKSYYNKNGSQLPCITYRAEGLLITHSPSEHVFVPAEMNCLLGCSLK